MNPVAPVTATLIVRSRSWRSAHGVWTRCVTVPNGSRRTPDGRASPVHRRKQGGLVDKTEWCVEPVGEVSHP